MKNRNTSPNKNKYTILKGEVFGTSTPCWDRAAIESTQNDTIDLSQFCFFKAFLIINIVVTIKNIVANNAFHTSSSKGDKKLPFSLIPEHDARIKNPIAKFQLEK